jgi:hypothetical protein
MAFRLVIGVAALVTILSGCGSDTIQIDPTTAEGKQCVYDARMDLRACEALAHKQSTDCVERERTRAEIPYQRRIDRYEREVSFGLRRYQQAMDNYYRMEDLRQQCEERNEDRAYRWDRGQTNVRPRYEDCPEMPMPLQDDFIPEEPTLHDVVDDDYCYGQERSAEYACKQTYDDYYKKCGGRRETRDMLFGIEVGRRPI